VDAFQESAPTFLVRDCSLVALATGIRVQNLKEFREGLIDAPAGSIYHHFWGRLLTRQFSEPEYNNDFAAWARHGLYEKGLAERLSVINPTEFDDMEELRQELVEVVEVRLDESEFIPWARSDQQFHFIRSQIVVLDTGREISRPEELAAAVPEMSNESIFYHFIDARRRTPDRVDDFTGWLTWLGEEHREVIELLAAIDPYFSSLTDVRNMVSRLFIEYYG
jgi:hypothetical protein